MREVARIVAVRDNGDVVVTSGKRHFGVVRAAREDPRLAGVAGIEENEACRVGLADFRDGGFLHVADGRVVAIVLRLVRELEDKLVRIVLVALGHGLPEGDELVGACGVRRIDREPAVEIQDDVEPCVDRVVDDGVERRKAGALRLVPPVSGRCRLLERRDAGRAVVG